MCPQHNTVWDNGWFKIIDNTKDNGSCDQAKPKEKTVLTNRQWLDSLNNEQYLKFLRGDLVVRDIAKNDPTKSHFFEALDFCLMTDETAINFLNSPQRFEVADYDKDEC